MTRRASGDGSLHLDKARGLWVGRLSLGYDSEGKRIRRSVYAATQREAREKLQHVREAHDAGMRINAGREPTVAQFLDSWLQDAHKPTVRATTYRRDESAIRVHLAPALGRHRLTTLSPQHIERMMQEKAEAGLKPRSIQQMRAVLRAALQQGIRWGLVTRNVAALTAGPRTERQEIPALDRDSALRIVHAVHSDRLEAVVTVALAVGLRQAEALGLRWDDLDLDARTLRVNQTIQRVDGELVSVPPKTAKSRRTIPLPSFAVLALRGHRTRQLEERLQAGEGWSDAGLVFTGARGQALDGPHVTRRFQRILASVCRLCGARESDHAGAADHDFRALPRMRFHDRRHGAASLMLAQGVPLSTISEILGHSGIRITADTYAHLTDELKRDAANAMDAAFGDTAEQAR